MCWNDKTWKLWGLQGEVHCEVMVLWVWVQNPEVQDPPGTLNWGYMVPHSGYLGPNRG